MLHERSREFVGRQLLVTSLYGWGWTRSDDPGPGTAKSVMTVPETFHARLLELWSWEGELRGGIARVDEPAHELHQYFACFSLRHEGEFALDQPDVHYNIDIGPEKPVYNERGWPFPQGVPAHHGYATIRVAARED
jgi:hypothetical protein